MTPLIVVGAVGLILLVSGLRIAQEYERGVVFRLGRFKGLRGPGLFWIVPLAIERAVIIDIRTQTVSAEQQETITRDSVTIKLNAVLWYRIVDAGKSVIAVSEAPNAVYQLALTEVGAENNSTTVLMIPSEFATLSKTLSEYLRERS